MQKNIPLTGGYSLNLLVSEGGLEPLNDMPMTCGFSDSTCHRLPRAACREHQNPIAASIFPAASYRSSRRGLTYRFIVTVVST